MIADLPTRVLRLIVADPAPVHAPPANDASERASQTMNALIAQGKRSGFTTNDIADAIDRRIRRYLDTVGHRGEGDRNDTAYRVARWLSNDFGTSDAVTWAYLVEWNAGNTPPLTEHELAQTMRSAKRSGRRPAGCAHRPRGTAA